MSQSLVALTPQDLLDLRRKHVLIAGEWAVSAGTDFWLVAAANGTLTASTTWLITDGGWTATSMGAASGSAADFITKSDSGTPGSYTTNAGADLLQSPSIFGDYAHAHQAAVICGQMRLPRYLVMDAFAALTTGSADEQTSNLGFVEDGGSIVVANDQYFSINTDSTNWCVTVNGSRLTNTTDVAVTSTYHWFRIVLDRAGSLPTTGTGKAYIDGTLIATGALTDDEAPVGWGIGDGTTNRWAVAQTHIFYAWALPPDPQFF